MCTITTVYLEYECANDIPSSIYEFWLKNKIKCNISICSTENRKIQEKVCNYIINVWNQNT